MKKHIDPEQQISSKSFKFSIRVVKLYKFLRFTKREFVISTQLLRAGTSIGSNAAESEHAQSKADFISKLSIALKEADETRYWLRLLEATDYLTKEQAESMLNDCVELIRMLASAVKTLKEKSG